MIHLRRAGIALAAVALALGSAPAIAHAETPSPTTKSVPDTSYIRFDNVAPAVIPKKGTIVITGTLHNGSGETWHELSVEPANSYYPLSTTAELDSAPALDPDTVHLGQPMPDFSESLSDLKSGGTEHFRIVIPRASLQITGDAGAYWLGVTPLTGLQPITDSLTARTFLPLLPKPTKKAQLNIALVVPVRDSFLRNTAGTVADPAAFGSSLSAQGRLGLIARFGADAGARPLTWLVDPALLDLVDDTASDSAAYGLGAAGSTPNIEAPTPSPSTTGSTKGQVAPPPPSPTTGSSQPPADPMAQLKATAKQWSAAITTLLKNSAATFALPYGDPMIAALVASGHEDLLSTADELSAQSMTDRKVSASAAIAPASGNLSQSEWSTLTTGQTAFVGDAETDQTQATSADGRTLVVASPASDGGPGPGDTKSALNIRQRLLAEAALAAGSTKATNLTVVLPADWDPGSAAGVDNFFAPLSRSWISFTGLPQATPGTVTMAHASPTISGSQLAAVGAALQLRDSVAALDAVLATSAKEDATLARQFGATEFSTVSHNASSAPAQYAANAAQTASSLDGALSLIKVEGTPFVTLSGSSGVITVAIHNGMNVPVKIGLRQIDKADGSSVAVDPVAAATLEPGERTTLRITVTAPRVSVQEVTLSAVTASGVPVGTALTFTLRSSSVGAVVWAITIGIVLILVLLVGRSMRRRWREKREAR